jgi:hypothetical protein
MFEVLAVVDRPHKYPVIARRGSKIGMPLELCCVGTYDVLDDAEEHSRRLDKAGTWAFIEPAGARLQAGWVRVRS